MAEAACRSLTACVSVLPQKSSWPTGSSGRSKRHAQYRVTGAFEAAETAWMAWGAFPAGVLVAAGQVHNGSRAP